MNEAEYKKAIRDDLNGNGAKVIPLVTGEMTERGTPDIIGVIDGLAFVIEAKVEGNEPTDIQKERLKEWLTAGAIPIIATYPHHKPEMIYGFLSMLNEDHGWIPHPKTLVGYTRYFYDYCNSWLEGDD